MTGGPYGFRKLILGHQPVVSGLCLYLLCLHRLRVWYRYSGHSNAMARAIQNHTLWLLFAKGESLRFIPAHTIAVRLCHASQWLLFLQAVSSCGTVSSSNSMHKKTTLAIWRRIPHITPVLYKVYLPITEGFAELEHYVSCANSRVSVICTNIHRYSATWMRQRNICLFLQSTDM